MSDSRPAGGEAWNESGLVFPRSPLRLRLVPVSPECPHPPLVEWLAHALEPRVAAPAVIGPVLATEPEWWTSERSQLESNRIIDTLIERYPLADDSAGEWVLALATADLRGGGRDFVFGEAALGGAWAVVSVARFGVPGQLLRERLLKEALHELGHLAGLRHCTDSRCVMRASIDVAEVDGKSALLCSFCQPHGHGE